MVIIVNDEDVCPICGAYWQDNGYCCNGHLKDKVAGAEMDRIEVFGVVYDIDDEFCRTMDTLDRKTLLEMLDHYTSKDAKIEWIKEWHKDDET